MVPGLGSFYAVVKTSGCGVAGKPVPTRKPVSSTIFANSFSLAPQTNEVHMLISKEARNETHGRGLLSVFRKTASLA